jgi:WD40 repeat protein
MVHDFSVWSVNFSPDGKYVVSSGDNTARVWDVTSGREIARMQHDVFAELAMFSPNSKYVVSGGCDQRKEKSGDCMQGSARVWDAKTGVAVARMIHDSKIYAAAFSPDGKYVVSGGCDRRDDSNQSCLEGAARVWDAKTGTEIARMVHKGTVRVVAFSPNGKYVVSGSDDETARVWNATTGSEISRMRHWAGPITDSTVNLSPNQGTVRAVAFSPDSKYVVSGGCDQRDAITTICTAAIVRVWEAATGHEIGHIEHADQVNAVAFSPDGRFVISGSWDGTARVWEAKTGLEIARTTYKGAVLAVAFSPDGKSVITAGCDEPGPPGTCNQGSARTWIWQSNDLIANACARVTRNLTRAEWEEYIGDALPYQAICENLPVEPVATP